MTTQSTDPKARKTRRCQCCGDQFVPYHSGDRWCGNRPECDREAAEAERYEARRESAEQDDYGRY